MRYGAQWLIILHVCAASVDEKGKPPFMWLLPRGHISILCSCATFGEALDRVMEAGPANPASPAGQVLRLISRLPTVLMSTDDSPDIIIGSVKAGAVDFICKVRG